jgi:putative transposase
MREMGIQAVYPRQNTSKPNPANKVYPYLLSGLDIIEPDHVWSIDITYIPIRRSWLYLTAIIDWYSRYVVAWMIDDTLEIGFVLEACTNALYKVRPKIMNSDQGSHFTSPKYTEMFLAAGVEISMDHRGRAYDNIFIERLWRTVKYENVYLRSYETPRDARMGISQFLDYYNNERPHQSLDYRTPAEVYKPGN